MKHGKKAKIEKDKNNKKYENKKKKNNKEKKYSGRLRRTSKLVMFRRMKTIHLVTQDRNYGPLTQSRTKKLKEQMNSFLTYCNANTSMLMLVWFTHEDMEGTWPKDQEKQCYKTAPLEK